MRVNFGTKVRHAVFAAVILMTLLFVFLPFKAQAKDLDEIENYQITVDVNSDGTLTMRYHIDWRVLDSTSEGPLSWVMIGIPNKNYKEYKALSGNIKHMDYTTDNGTGLKITLDRNYYQDEVVSFEFELIQDYMYQMNLNTEGETVYQFTPGWFDDIDVDNLEISWNGDNVLSVTPEYEVNGDPACEFVDGYYVWSTPLARGKHYTVEIVYPNDAYDFDTGKKIGGPKKKIDPTFLGFILAMTAIFGLAILVTGFQILKSFFEWLDKGGVGRYEKKITRTVIEYYPNCPNCGGPRPEGKEVCEYCGTNFVKSEKVVEEKKVPKDLKGLKNEIFNFKDDGIFALSSSPTTYVRVQSKKVRKKATLHTFVSSMGDILSTGSSSSTSSRGGGGCAHSSCACACACACAGGGRAGCTTKDFYGTKLKYEYFQDKKKQS